MFKIISYANDPFHQCSALSGIVSFSFCKYTKLNSVFVLSNSITFRMNPLQVRKTKGSQTHKETHFKEQALLPGAHLF